VKSAVLAQLNTTATDVIARILDAGHRGGTFSRQVERSVLRCMLLLL
jgi:hypothetical protein